MSDVRSRYEACAGPNPIAPDFLRKLERELGVSLPASFLAAAAYFDGRGIVALPLHPMADIPANVLDETLRLRRAINLPNRFIVLGEPPESLLVLDCIDGTVIWCDATDATGLGEGRFSQKPHVWTQFSDFLEFLLDEQDAEGPA